MEQEEEQKVQNEESRIHILDSLLESLRSFEYGEDFFPLPLEEEDSRPKTFLEELGFKKLGAGVTKNLQEFLRRFRCKKSSKLCSICMAAFELDALMLQLPCKHLFHEQCIQR